ncbi:hypothetical protein Busp01_06050 [Trinickia caryophylli]|nr:hypothetical protein Busp01_06050 [Trinickia caryophylli]
MAMNACSGVGGAAAAGLAGDRIAGSKAGQAAAAFFGESRERARKVRTPQGRVMANGHPWRHAEQGNRKQTADGPARAGIR